MFTPYHLIAGQITSEQLINPFKMSQSYTHRIQKNAHQFEKRTIHTGPDSEKCAQLCAYCANTLPNQAFCEST